MENVGRNAQKKKATGYGGPFPGSFHANPDSNCPVAAIPGKYYPLIILAHPLYKHETCQLINSLLRIIFLDMFSVIYKFLIIF